MPLSGCLTPTLFCRDPNVGLPVCAEALQRAPAGLNYGLLTPSSSTGSNEIWLIGGSTDLLYIPGQSRDDFMTSLELFMRTECYSHIAVPTALHLAIPTGEHISFVDLVSNIPRSGGALSNRRDAVDIGYGS